MSSPAQPSLEELRERSRSSEVEKRVLAAFASRLVEAHHLAEKAGEQASADALFAELNELNDGHPELPVVYEFLATCLFNSHVKLRGAADKARAAQLLEGLREMEQSDRCTSVVVERYSTALQNAHIRAGRWHDADLAQYAREELSRIAADPRASIEVSERLAAALCAGHSWLHAPGKREEAAALLDRLRDVVAKHPENDTIADREEEAVANESSLSAKAGDGSRAEQFLNELRSLGSRPGAKPSFSSRLASTLRTLYVKSTESVEDEPPEAIVGELRSMAVDGSAEVRIQFAKALRSKHWHLGKQGKFDNAETSLVELRALGVLDPEREILDELAASLNNAQHMARKAGFAEAANGYLREIEDLCRANPDNVVIGNHYSKCLYGFHLESRSEPRFGSPDAHLEKLQSLSDRFPSQIPIRESLGKSLLTEVIDHPNSPEGLGFRRRLEALAKSHETESELCDLLTRAYYSAHYAACNEGDFSVAAPINQVLGELATSAKSTETIRVRFGKLLHTEVYFAFEHKNLPVAESAMREQRSWQSAYPDSTKIAESLARSLVSVARAALDRDEAAEAGEALEELRQLGRRYPESTDIPRGLVEVLYQLYSWGAYDGPESYSDSPLQEMRQIYIKQPTDMFIHEWLAYALGLATNFAWFQGKPFKARHLWGEFVFVVESDGPDPKLRAKLDELKADTAKRRWSWAWSGFRQNNTLMSVVFGLILLVVYLWDLSHH